MYRAQSTTKNVALSSPNVKISAKKSGDLNLQSGDVAALPKFRARNMKEKDDREAKQEKEAAYSRKLSISL